LNADLFVDFVKRGGAVGLMMKNAERDVFGRGEKAGGENLLVDFDGDTVCC